MHAIVSSMWSALRKCHKHVMQQEPGALAAMTMRQRIISATLHKWLQASTLWAPSLGSLKLSLATISTSMRGFLGVLRKPILHWRVCHAPLMRTVGLI